MKLKKSAKLVVSRKMFASTKSLSRKDSGGKNSEVPKKKKKKNPSNTSPKKSNKEKTSSTSRSKTARAEKESSKLTVKTKTGKSAEKSLGSPYKLGISSSKHKHINWSELGVQRCQGCNFTTNEEGIFAAHISLCRLYNKDKIKSPSTSPNKKQSSKSDISVNFAEKPDSNFGKMIGIPEKRAVIQEPYLEGSSPAQTVFLFRCYHCRSYFINIQTLKDHHRLAHGNKNLTVSLVPFTDDEAPDDLNKKIIVDGSSIVPRVNWRRENMNVIPASSTTTTLQCHTDSTSGVQNSMQSHVPSQSQHSVVTTSAAVVTPQTYPKLVSLVNSPLHEVCVQTTPFPDPRAKTDGKVIKKEDIQKSPVGESFQNRLKLVPTQGFSSTTNQPTTNNKMVVLNLIPKSQSVPCSSVQIEIPASSSVNAHNYVKQNLNIAQPVTQTIQTSQEGSKNLNSSAKTKTILPKSLLLGVHPTPVMDFPMIVPQTSKLGPNPGVTVISTAQKVTHTTVAQSINSPAITSSLSSTKQKNRKIILFPLTSNTNTGATLVTPGTTLTATPIATAITTSAVFTCATMTSPSMAIPLSSSFVGSSLQTTVSPVLISPTPTIIASSIPSVWVLPSQTNLTSVGPKLISSPAQNVIPKPPQVLTKTIHITPTPTKVMQPSSTSLCVTTQTVTTVTTSSPSSTSKNTSPNRPVQNQIVTITPVSPSTSSALGMSLLEKVSIVKSSKSEPVTTPEKLDLPSSDSASLKPDNLVKVSSNSKIQINEGSTVTSPEERNNSKSTQCFLSAINKRKIDPNSDVSLSQIVPSPKKKAYVSSQTSLSKRANPEDAPSLSTSTSKSVSTTEDFTVALLAKKKVPISTTCTSIIKKSLSKSSTSNISPLVIVRKSVGSNKLVVHTMVSASKLFQIKDSDVLTCSLCSDNISVKLIKDHLYWHFHVENRNSAQCSKDNPCHYCSVIDYVVSTIPQSTQPEINEDTSSQTNPKPPSDDEKLNSSSTKSRDICSPVECSPSSISTEPLGLKISSTFSLQTEENSTKQSKESSHVEPGNEEPMQTDKSLEEKSKSSLDPPQTTSPRKKEIENNNNITKSPTVDIETIDETENHQIVNDKEKNDVCDKPPLLINNSFKEESPSQAEKNSIYEGNFYICGFKDCTYSSPGMEAFQSHQEDHHCDADGYSCVHCQLECIDPSALVRHMVTHLCGDMFILYRCAFPECNFGTNLMRSFCGHNVEAHSREPIFLCYYCSAHFQGCVALQKHLQANLLKYVHCPHCSVRNGMRDTILSHIKSDHPGKPRRIFVTGQMVCQQKQKVQIGSKIIDSESDSSDIDSDCMIVDDDILDRHLIRQNNVNVHDIFEKEARSKNVCKQANSISEGQNSNSDDDCMIIDKDSCINQNSLSVLDKSPKKMLTLKKMSNVSPSKDNKIQDGTDPKLIELTEPALLKKNEAITSKQTGNLTEAVVLNSSNSSLAKNTPKDLKNVMPTTTDKDSVESEEGSVYLRVKKVTQTYSRQKENRLSLRQRQLVDKKEANKETSLKSKASNSDGKNSTTVVKPCRRTILTRSNKSRGKVDIGTAGLDSIINPLYLAVDNEMHCRICTFKCVLLMKMHAHILLMHLHVFLYQCNVCRKKGSCKVEMTEHCDQHGQKNKGFAVLPEPDWEQVLRSCQPATCRTSNLKSPVTEATRSKTMLLNKTKLSKTENSLSSKKVGQKKSTEISKPVCSRVAPKNSSPNAKISSNEDRNIFSLFSFDLDSEAAAQKDQEKLGSLESCSSSKTSKFHSSFPNKLFSLPTLPNYDKTPVKNLPDRKLRQRTPTPESHERITVGKEQYMRELHLISISKVSNSKQKNSPQASMLPQLSQSLHLPMSRLRSWRTPLGKTPFVLASKSQQGRKSKRPRSSQGRFISCKILRKKVLAKASKLKLRAARKRRPIRRTHLLRSASKLRHSPRNLKMRTEAIKPLLLKPPEKYVVRKRPQNLKSLSSSLPAKPTPPKLKVTKHLDMNLRKVKSNPRKLVKATVKRTVTKKKNLTISHGQRSIKKALNQASRKKSAQAKGRILTRNRVCKRRPLMKISSSKFNTKKQISIRGSINKNCLYFSCSWCQFKVPDREHFQRHISLHNFFPQGSKMHCPYCSYTTPSALVLEKHIPMHMDKHPFGCRHCGFSAKTKMMVVRHCKRSHPDIPLKLVNRSTSSQKLKPSWPIVSFCPKVRLKKCAFKAGSNINLGMKNRSKSSETKN